MPRRLEGRNLAGSFEAKGGLEGDNAGAVESADSLGAGDVEGEAGLGLGGVVRALSAGDGEGRSWTWAGSRSGRIGMGTDTGKTG